MVPLASLPALASGRAPASGAPPTAPSLPIFEGKCYHGSMCASRARNFVVAVLVAFVAAILFCALSVSATGTDEPMSGYVSQGEVAMRGGNPGGHLVWQNILHATPQKVFGVPFAALLFAAGFLIGRRRFSAPSLAAQRLRTRMSEGHCSIDPIRRALSLGIIRSQIYEIAIG